MGILGGILGGVGKFLGTAFNGVAESAGGIASTILTNNANKQMHESDNAFNAEQAQINRDFQADQAQNQMDFQERMYTQYQSPEALVEQYQKAGLNPALMFQNGGSSGGNFSGAAGAGAQAAAASPIAMQSPLDALTLSLARKNDAETRLTNSKNEEQQMLNQRWNERFDAEVSNLKASTDEKEAARKLTLLDVDQKDQMFSLLKKEQELKNQIKEIEKRIAEETEDSNVEAAKQQLALLKQNVATNRAQEIQLLASANLQETESEAILERLPAEIAELGTRSKQEAASAAQSLGSYGGLVTQVQLRGAQLREKYKQNVAERKASREMKHVVRHNKFVRSVENSSARYYSR